VTSCVVTEAEATPRDPLLPPDQQTALAILAEVITDEGRDGFAGVPEGVKSVPEAWWRERFYLRAKPAAKQDAKQKAYKRAVDGLVNTGRVAAHGERVWIP
jgi:hypothetical protein